METVDKVSNYAKQTNAQAPVISSKDLLEHWQGQRRLTRKVINAFPDDKLFSYSIGGMRPFSELVLEMISMAGPGMEGVVTKKWNNFEEGNSTPRTKEEILKAWDETTVKIDTLWPQVSVERFQEVDLAFGQYEGTIISTILYFIDNEVHHRGQGYVYLRSLNIEPPFFWERD